MRFVVQASKGPARNRLYRVVDLHERGRDGAPLCVDCFDDDYWKHGEAASRIAEALAQRLNTSRPRRPAHPPRRFWPCRQGLFFWRKRAAGVTPRGKTYLAHSV